jgi:hemolysin III
MEVAPGVKPRLRGVWHQYAFVVSLVVGALLVTAAPGALERASSAVFAGAVAAMFGISALYHRRHWEPTARRWLRRLDHTAIYLLIAGTYTPFALLALDGAWRWSVAGVVWSGAAVAIVLKFVWVDAPKWVAAVIASALGWVGVVALPQLYDATGAAGLAFLAAGGLFYTAGALIYALRRPDPVPEVFGYHEVFHALVIAAAACQYVAVAIVVFRG